MGIQGRLIIVAVLIQRRGLKVKSKAAKSLKIHRSALYRKMLKYNIDL
jgi:transcriptional regulator with PAS, ATPase and Fis domain